MEALTYITTKAMLQLGFSPAYNGFYFLRDAVLTAIKDPEAITLVTKLIYAPLAKMYGTTAQNIEKSIRKAAEAVWASDDNTGKKRAVLNQEYCLPEMKLENRELISLLCGFVEQSVQILDTDSSNGV